MLLWDRQAALSFGVRGNLGPQIMGNRIAFSLGKTSDSEENNSKIMAYNLRDSTRAVLESGAELVAVLEAGYRGHSLSQLFVGDVKRSTHTKRGPDWVTTLHVGDGSKALTNVSFAKSYKAGFDTKAIVAEVAEKMRTEAGVVVTSMADLSTMVTQNGYAAEGQAKDILDDLLTKMGLEWSIQDGELVIKEPETDVGVEAVLLTPETGLIGSPIRKEKGLEVRALLQPKIKPGVAVRLQSAVYDGYYQVKKIQSKGDTHGRAWYTQAIMEELGA